MNRRTLAATGLLAVIAAVPYLPGALRNRFAFDDARFLYFNPHVTNPESWHRPFWDGRTMDPTSPTGAVRPLRTLEFALDHHFFGLDPAAFHLHSLLWHVLAAVLLYFVLRRLIGGARPALFGAIVWAVHPMQVESVAWISSRNDVASGACAFAALLFALHSNSWRDRAAWLGYGCALIGMLYKESVVVLPLLVFAVRLVRPREDASGEPRNPPGRVLPAARAALPWFVVTALYMSYRSWVMIGTWDHTSGHQLGGSVAGTFATMFRAFGAYLGFAVLPVRPSIDWYMPVSDTLADPVAIVWLVVHLALIVAAFRWRTRRPVIAGAVCLFYFGLLTVANWPVQIGIPTAERFLYVPLAGLALLVAAGLQRLAVREPAATPGSASIGGAGVGSMSSRARSLQSAWIAVGLAAVAMATISYRRTADWESDRTLWPATIALHDSPRGLYYMSAEQLKEARSLRAQAAETADVNTRNALLAQADQLLRSARDHAVRTIAMWHRIEHVERVQSTPIIEPYNNASNASFLLGDQPAALRFAERALDVAEHLYPQSHYNRALALEALHRPAAALAAMLRARQLGLDDAHPEFTGFFVRVARTCRDDGFGARALEAYAAAVAVGAPGAPTEQAAVELEALRRHLESRRARAREDQLADPEDVAARLGFAAALVDLGRVDEADTLVAHVAWTNSQAAVAFVRTRYEGRGTDDALQTAFERYSALGDDTDAVLGAARCAEELRLDDRARSLFERFLVIAPPDHPGRRRAAASLDRIRRFEADPAPDPAYDDPERPR